MFEPTPLITQTASRSNQPFFHNSPTGQTHRQTHTPTDR